MPNAANIRHEVARALNQVRWLRTRTEAVSVHSLPYALNRLAGLIADHAVAARGMR